MMSIAWTAVALSGFVAGVCLVGVLVARRPLDLVALALVGSALIAAATAAARLAAAYDTAVAGLIGFAFASAALAGGYRLAASALLGALGTNRPPTAHAEHPHGLFAVILGDAEPERYSPRYTAARLSRIDRFGSTRLAPGVVPMIFLAERMRYRALHGPHPARFVVQSIAQTASQRLAQSWPETTVTVAYLDDSPRLLDTVATMRPIEAVVLELGAAGSLPFVEAQAQAEQANRHDTRIRVVSPTIWRNPRLAHRLVERIAERAPENDRSVTGVVLLGSGIPEEWRAASARWEEDENYFITRTTVLLQEAGFPRAAVKAAWLEWQDPTLTDAARHLAAVGCTRIIIAPATVIYPNLSMMLDLERDLKDARLPESVRTTVLTPWGDDPVLVDAVVSCLHDELSRRKTS